MSLSQLSEIGDLEGLRVAVHRARIHELEDALARACRAGFIAATRVLLQGMSARGIVPPASCLAEAIRFAAAYEAPALGAEVVRGLVDAGADVNGAAGYGGEEAIFEAASRFQLEIVELLLDAGADPDRIDARGETPLDKLRALAEFYETPAQSRARLAKASAHSRARSDRMRRLIELLRQRTDYARVGHARDAQRERSSLQQIRLMERVSGVPAAQCTCRRCGEPLRATARFEPGAGSDSLELYECDSCAPPRQSDVRPPRDVAPAEDEDEALESA